MNKQRLYEIFCYVFFGGVGTVINILIFYLLSQRLSIHFIIANIIAWMFSIVFAFVTNKVWVFKSKSWHFTIWFKECIQFFLARIGTCFFDMIYMFIAITIFHFEATISKIVANVIVVLLNYILSKIWIFKHKKTNYLS